MTSCGPSLKNKPLTGPTNTEPGTETLGMIFGWGSLKPKTYLRVLSTVPFNQVDLQSVTMSRPIPNGQPALGSSLRGIQRSSMP